MKIDYHPYMLRFKGYYGGGGEGATREGALLRVTFDDGLVGYCDCHPWVELGDIPLSKQLQALTNPDRTPTPLLSCSLKFARIDAEARREGRSVFEGLDIPPSHQLVSLTDSLKPFIDQGNFHFKIKMGFLPEKEIESLSRWCGSYPNIRIRLDFSEKLTRNDFLHFWGCIPIQVKLRVDFIEDPYPFDPVLWEHDQLELKIPFSADKQSELALQHPDSSLFLVHKPAAEEFPQLTEHSNRRLVVTTYLDHPFGQMCAAYAAAKLKALHPRNVGFCGLLTHVCYEKNPFSDFIQSNGPTLHPTEGTGFGFNQLLEEISWQSP